MYEIYIHGTHTTPFDQNDGVQYELLAPILRWQRIIVSAGSTDGFVPNLYSRSYMSKSNYHGATNFRNYKKWLVQKVILNPFPYSVAVTLPPPIPSK
jgi:hypothetical protein